MSAKERPILFSAPMVRAILEGRKTQTRRVVKPQPKFIHAQDGYGPLLQIVGKGVWFNNDPNNTCPYGQVGHGLWVRESWGVQHCFDWIPPSEIPKAAQELHREIHIHYTASEDLGGLIQRPSIHMPRWASRITLEIVNVRVERLEEIGEDDAIAEGIAPNWCGNIDEWDAKKHGWKNYLKNEDGTECMYPTSSFRSLWDSINAPRGHGWATNPWVWAISFKVV